MDIKSADIVKCLPVLASVLGAKYGVKIIIGGHKAYTDGNVIHLPALPMDSDEELLMLVKGYTDHESAHIRFTDFEELGNASLTKIEKVIFNCIEDWRVERKLSQLYPGCRHNLNKLIHRFFVEQDDWAGETPALSILSYVLLTLRSWDVKEVCEPLKIRGYVLEQNYPALKSALDPILSRIQEQCESTEDAIAYAREIVSCICQLGENRRSENGSPAPSQRLASEDEGSLSNNLQSHSHIDEKSHDDDRSLPIPAVMEKNEDMHIDSSAAMQSQDNGENSLIDEIESSCEAVKDIGEKISDALENRKGEKDGTPINVAVECEPWQKRLDNEECAEALRATVAMQQRLQGMLQTRELKRIAIGRHGKLSQSSLYRLAIANPDVFSKHTPAIEIQTAIHILLDRSSSMSGSRMNLARKTCYAISKALDGIRGVAHAVSAFPMQRTDGMIGMITIKRYEQMTRENFALTANGDTPLDAAILGILPELLKRHERRKLMLIITDGMPNDLASTKKVISIAKNMEIEVYAIGIKCEMYDLQATGERNMQVLSDLPTAVFNLLRNRLLH